ncbi:uncharacterized protein [Prorops nasuta]|uniref:uncharacterized protein n=1 Tax=Prorops nasuta TaxID=863751 RepID=UPI0034CE41B3
MVMVDDNSSSSDEENHIPKITNYAEEIIPKMIGNQFKCHFRMTQTSFEALLNMAEHLNHLNNANTSSFPIIINLRKQFLIMIWYLANLESLRSVAERFGVSKSMCWKVLYRACNILVDINKTYQIIKWPNRERQIQITQGFSKDSFVGVIGCIDGSHIKIKRPKHNSNSYVNRKGYHSLLLQGICDHQKLFIDVYAGEVGSLHDYTLYKRSDIYKDLKNGQAPIFNENYLLGDLAYKLSPMLIVGFKDNGHLTNTQKLFNQTISKIRVKIEHTFGLLKSRFRRLIYLETRRLDLCVLLILSACILHNICIFNIDNIEALQFNEENELEILENEVDNSEDEEDIEHDSMNKANAKRNEIIQGL